MTGLLGQLPVLVVAVPLLGAALVAAFSLWLPRVAADLVALALAACCTVGAGWLCAAVDGHRIVLWLGDWEPAHGRSVGIALVADRGAAVLAVLAGALTVAALAYSWRFLEDIHESYHALVLVFLAAMCGFVFAGDLFDAFVWFELMGVVAYALTGMRIEEPRSVQGALSFGIVNSLGASAALVGIALLYARTGELNLAAIGESLRDRPADDLVTVAWALLLSGFLVKAAAAPFHFWTADAEAVAPSPVCALLSGVMVMLGVYGVARLWWVVFDPVLGTGAMRAILLVVGLTTALVGAVVCVGQRHLKRMLAYSTVSHVGVVVVAVGLLSESGLTAAGLYALGQAGVKAALFLATGVLLNRFETVDEHALFARGRDMPVTAAIFVVGGLGLAGAPGIGTWIGKSALEHSAVSEHLWWLLPAVFASSVLTGGTVLRATLRIFAGAGPAPSGRPSGDPGSSERSPADSRHEERPETSRPLTRIPWSMLSPALMLLAASLCIALVPAVRTGAATAAATFVDGPAYAAAVLQSGPAPPDAVGAPLPVWTWPATALGLFSAALAIGVALLGVWGSRLPAAVKRAATLSRGPIDALHALHSGHVGDYVAWLLLGTAAIGGALLLSS